MRLQSLICAPSSPTCCPGDPLAGPPLLYPIRPAPRSGQEGRSTAPAQMCLEPPSQGEAQRITPSACALFARHWPQIQRVAAPRLTACATLAPQMANQKY